MWMCIFAVLLWVIIKGHLQEKKYIYIYKKIFIYLFGNFEDVCREMTGHTNKWLSPGGC